MPSEHVEFTREMREAGYTILAPNMLDFHFSLLEKVLRLNGYNVEVLHNDGQSVKDEGLKYVHNDTCVPALLVIGQFIDALHSGKYDLNRVALAITQTGGGCRASNYIHLLRKALKKAGLSQIPVISINMSGLESASGFGAEALVTACPLCLYNLNKAQNGLPVVYFTELLAEALGVKEAAT